MNESRIQGAASALSAHSKDALSPEELSAKPGGHSSAATSGGDAEGLQGRVQAGAERAGAAISDAAARVSATASDLGAQAYDRATRAGDDAVQVVRDQPFASVLIGAAIGYSLAFLIHRPRYSELRAQRWADYVPRR